MAITNTVQTENELVKLAQNGDRSAFAQLYDFYIRKIYDFVYYKTLNKEWAEDIVSHVFLKAWQSISSYRQNSFSSWLYAIARNTVIDFYRREKQHKDIDDVWDLASDSDLFREVDNRLQINKIKEAMSGLKSLERDVIIMRFWLDMPFSEIASRLNKNEGAVKMTFKRALGKVKGEVLLVIIFSSPQIINIWKKMS
jgi:RNA polymerase sigma-70 factor (ECF subfamily)